MATKSDFPGGTAPWDPALLPGGHGHPTCTLTPSPGLSSGNSSLLPARVASSPPHGTWVWSMNLLLGLSWTPRRRFLVSAEDATLVDGSLEVLVTSLPPRGKACLRRPPTQREIKAERWRGSILLTL